MSTVETKLQIPKEELESLIQFLNDNPQTGNEEYRKERRLKNRRKRYLQKRLSHNPNWQQSVPLTEEQKRENQKQTQKRYKEKNKDAHREKEKQRIEANPEYHKELYRKNSQIMQIRRLDPLFKAKQNAKSKSKKSRTKKKKAINSNKLSSKILLYPVLFTETDNYKLNVMFQNSSADFIV